MKQFNLDRIWYIRHATNHIEAESVFADVGTEVYRWTGSSIGSKGSEFVVDPRNNLYWRDYWSFFTDRADKERGPYFQEVLDAQHVTIIDYLAGGK